MRLSRGSILSLLILLSAIPGESQELSPKPDKPPIFVEEAGQTTRLVFPDGRVATLMSSESEAATFSFPFKVTENLCRPQAVSPHCTYEAGYRQERVNFVWTTNADASRMGQKLERSYSPNVYSPFENDDLLITNYLRTLQKKISVELPPDRIVCDHYDWLPVDAASGLVQMKVWSGEIMNINSETQMNENQSLLMYSNLRWQLQSKTLTFQTFLQATTPTAVPPLTDTSMVVFEDVDGACQVTIGSNLALLAQFLRGPEKPLFKPASANIKLRALLPNFYSQINSFIKAPNYRAELIR